MKDTNTAKVELLNDLDIAFHDATVELLDGRLTIMADRTAITLDAAVVNAIRAELNAEYTITPRSDDSLYVTRVSDGVRAVAYRRRYGYGAWLVGSDGPMAEGPTPLAAAKAVFFLDDHAAAKAVSA